MAKQELHAAGMTKEQQYAAVEAAQDAAELNRLWGAWEKVGHSQSGLLYARVLERKAELGITLSEDEQAAVRLANQRRERGKQLPPVTGKIKRPGGR